MTDYWLSKLFFELHNPALAVEYRADRAKVLDRYPLKPEVRAAAMRDDVAYIAPLVNPYLSRYYFQVIGMADAEFIRQLRALKTPQPKAAHG